MATVGSLNLDVTFRTEPSYNLAGYGPVGTRRVSSSVQFWTPAYCNSSTFGDGRRSPCHARGDDQLRRHVELVGCHYNFVRPHSALRFACDTRTPAMQAGLVSTRLALSDIFTARCVTLRVLVAVVETAAGGLPTHSWSYEQRTAA